MYRIRFDKFQKVEFMTFLATAAVMSLMNEATVHKYPQRESKVWSKFTIFSNEGAFTTGPRESQFVQKTENIPLWSFLISVQIFL